MRNSVAGEGVEAPKSFDLSVLEGEEIVRDFTSIS